MLTKKLPLGMKRRLSIAISLVANPKIVFLDEPTTGLDPETRRQLWNILQDCKNDKRRAIILTTHSMEEADVLCNRIGIVSDGILKCIGT
jgi:ABC-type multidrug transport system ATPase subunit